MGCGNRHPAYPRQLDLELLQTIMTNKFPHKPTEHEAEKASNSYLMSLVALVAGLPLPIINLFATFAFFIANRKGTYFVRWHCTQALFSQLCILMLNSGCFWWTVYIIFGEKPVSNEYFAYLFTVILVNIVEFISTIYTAIETRKGKHVELWFFGGLTNLTCRK
jgi:hypothetical protein